MNKNYPFDSQREDMKNALKVFTLIITIISINCFSIKAQNNDNITLTGQVIEEVTKLPVEYATVRLLKPDSSLVKGGTSDDKGFFKLPAKANDYILQVSFIGFNDTFIPIKKNEKTNLGKIELSENSIMLNEAVVEAKAVEIMVKGDTIEYNADSYKVQESAALEDLLKKMPGVEVDKDGKITVNGKEITKIMVDGKEFFSDDPKIASKNLPAKMVEKLQVLDKKSDMAMLTGFDDGNEETVINLTVKPGMKEGLFGNAMVGYGNHGRYEGNGMINYMRNNTTISAIGGINNTNNAGATDFASSMFSGGGRPRGLRFGGNNGETKSINGGINIATEFSKKLKLTGDIRYGETDNNLHTISNRTFTSEQNPGTEYSDTRGRNKNRNFATNFRLEWKPDSLTTIQFIPKVQYNTSDRNEIGYSETKYDATSPLASKNSTTDQTYSSNGNGYTLSGELNFNRKLNDRGRGITIGLKGNTKKTDTDGLDWNKILYDTHLNDTIIDQKFTQEDKSYNWSVTTSYVEPLKRNIFLELAYRISNSNSETDKTTWANTNAMFPNLNPDYSDVDKDNTRYIRNDFLNQNISARVKVVKEKYNFTLGVGLEPSSSKTELSEYLQDAITVPKKNFLSFAPSGQFNYIWDRNKNIRIDYSGVTQEPTTLQLFDGIYSRSGLNTTSGNPNLRPSFTHNLSVRYRSFDRERQAYSMLFARFKQTNNAIVSTSIINPTNGGRDASYDNISGNMEGNIRYIFNFPLRNKSWSLNSMSYASYSFNNTYIDGDKNKAKIAMLQENAGIQFRSDIFDFAVRGNIIFNNINNSISKTSNSSTLNYGGTYDFTFYMPNPFKGVNILEKIFSNITIDSDINYSSNSGYSGGFKQNEWLWNMSISKQLFSTSKGGTGLLRFKVYDILKNRSNISRTYDARYVEDIMTNTLSRYCIVHFVYRFQSMKGGATMDMMAPKGPRGPGGPGRGPH